MPRTGGRLLEACVAPGSPRAAPARVARTLLRHLVVGRSSRARAPEFSGRRMGADAQRTWLRGN
eukprot:3370811-Alexandrium_andersonii.AAC.1